MPRQMPADAVIIGGGVIGCLTAYYLTQRGLKPVVVESDRIASGASGLAGGILTPYSGSAAPEFMALSRASLDLHNELRLALPAATGTDYGYDSRPHLRCVFTEDGANRLKQWQKARSKEGFTTDWLAPRQAKSLTPWLTGDIVGAVVSEIEPTIDSYLFTVSAFKAAEKGGARLINGRVDGLLGQGAGSAGTGPSSRGVDRSSAQGVTLTDGTEIASAHTVIASGPWAGEAGDWLGYTVPVRPQKGQMLYLDPDHGGHPRPEVSLGGFDTGGSLTPKRLSETIVGATREEAGFDRTLTEAARTELLARGSKLSSRIMDARVVRQTACLRPMPADGKPYVGRAPGWEGVWLAVGHLSEGIHYAPLTGKWLADMIVDGKSRYDLSAISADRIPSPAGRE